MPLANPICNLQPSYGVVVIGSGYGGAIVAARLAAGRSLCILECGREWLPGTFPDSLEAVVGERRTERHPLGLYDYRPSDDVDVLVGCGLGGTSLINANVVLPPDPELFDDPRWPDEIRRDRESGLLNTYAARARDMLQVERYPADRPPLRKVEAHRQAARGCGAEFSLLDLAVNFTRYADAPNPVGVRQRLCTLCGDCVTGCNVGAKNVLTVNYLPLARQRGAQLFTQVEVDHLVKLPDGGYAVHYTYHPQDGSASRPGVLRASVVILAAGVLGTTEMLLRSRAYGLALSETLGHAFSGNGDVLGFGYNTEHQTNILGFGQAHDDRAQLPVGPTIVSAASSGQRARLTDRFLIEEGAIPRALVDLLRQAVPALNLAGLDNDRGDAAEQALRAGCDLLGDTPGGALNHSLLYLGMGHDGADGTLVLDHTGRVRLLWRNAPDQPICKRINAIMHTLATALGGTYLSNPRWHRALGRNLITVHPLGGCPMGADADHGVVDHRGRVFDPSRGLTAVHEGLFVADGSILPTAVGVNPLLTIAILAERIAALIQQDPPLDMVPRPFDPQRYGPIRAPLGLSFPEAMTGYLSFSSAGETEADFWQGYALGRQAGQGLAVHLWIAIEDLDAFLQDPHHLARVKGAIDYAPLGGTRTVEGGSWFQLFVPSHDPCEKHMHYSLKWTGVDGHPYLLLGVKTIHGDRPWSLWAEMTTLFTTLYRGDTPSAPVLGRGILRINLWQVLAQLASFRVHRAQSRVEHLKALARFGHFCGGTLWDLSMTTPKRASRGV